MAKKFDDAIESRLQDCLTVGQLIEELRSFPKSARVVFQHSYGDMGNTQQALPVTYCDSADDCVLTTSQYSASRLALEEAGDDCTDVADDRLVVLSFS